MGWEASYHSAHRDWFVPQYREAAGQLRHGLDLVQAFLWHMGSPMGFHIPEGVKMLPFQAAVSGQIPHAVGLAWGLMLQGKSDVVVVHFGEGGSSQGDFLEAANLAGVSIKVDPTDPQIFSNQPYYLESKQ